MMHALAHRPALPILDEATSALVGAADRRYRLEKDKAVAREVAAPAAAGIRR